MIQRPKQAANCLFQVPASTLQRRYVVVDRLPEKPPQYSG
jgi:hypothetical protein